jgi:hypothetical protein
MVLVLSFPTSWRRIKDWAIESFTLPQYGKSDMFDCSAARPRSPRGDGPSQVRLIRITRHDCAIDFAVPTDEFWGDRAVALCAFDAMEKFLLNCPVKRGIAYRLIIPAASPSQFSIGIYTDCDGTFGRFGGLGQDFPSVREALDWARRALTAEYRLHVVYAGSSPCEWSLEHISANSLSVVLASRHPVLFRRWKPRRHVYKTNDLLGVKPADSSGSSAYK